MIKKSIILIIMLVLTGSCSKPPSVDGVYRYYWGKKGGYDIWIIDGYKVRKDIYNYFLYGGNEQRYLFVPVGEIWIDHAVSCEEFEMTLAHELNERSLMDRLGWKYDPAHDSSLAIEVVMRRRFDSICRSHEAFLPKMPPRDLEGTKEIRDIPDSIYLTGIYRVPLGKREGISIWIVDGYKVRATVFPDFGFSGNDLEYRFIPAKEIWIDGQVSAEETEYSIIAELIERGMMEKGIDYDSAYGTAIDSTIKLRNAMEQLIRKHPPVLVPDSLTRP
jgi:hypothetical protein